MQAGGLLLRHETVRLGLVWLGIVALFSLLSPYFLSVANFLNIGLAVSIAGVAAAGVTVALISGSLDLSFPVVMGIAAVALAALRTADVPEVPAVALALALGAACGLLNGALTRLLRIDALLVTLATSAILGGILFMLTKSAIYKIPGEIFDELGRGRTLGLPNPLIVLVLVAVATQALIRYTRFGQETFVVGDNSYGAALSGISVTGIRVGALALSGLTAAIAGVLMGSAGGYAVAGDGDIYLLPVVAAVVLGGTLLSGGRGSMAGTVLGVLILGTIVNGLNILNVDPALEMVVYGVIVLMALSYYARSSAAR